MVLSRVPARQLLAVGPPIVAGLLAVGLVTRLSREQHDGAGKTAMYTDLRRPYLWSCVVFAVGAIVYAVVRLQVGGPTEAVTTVFALTTFTFSLPWTIFALNYVGRGHLLSTRRISVGIVYIGGIVGLGILDIPAVQSLTGSYPGINVVTAIMVLGVGVVVFAVSGLVLLSVYRHSTLELSHGVFTALPLLGLLFSLQFVSSITGSQLLDGVMSATWLTVAGALVLAPTRYEILAIRPGTGTAGERAAVRELDEAVITTEQDGTLARANSAAVALFGERLDDDSLFEIIGHEPAALAEQETIECWTADGRKQFDPRVTRLVNDYDEVYGYTVSLIDITAREMRRQRIEVLNRILRHNIRNSLDVIKANAEHVSDADRAAPILNTTDTLEQLSVDARRIESLLGRPQNERSMADCSSVVTAATRDIADTHPEASVSVDLPDLSVPVDADLCRFAIRNVVENAIVHNDGTEPRVAVRGTATDTGVRLVVADDGPGIPESEQAVIERRSESQQSHASSLGLWGINWAVQELGGELSFHDSDLGGTAVMIELPTN